MGGGGDSNYNPSIRGRVYMFPEQLNSFNVLLSESKANGLMISAKAKFFVQNFLNNNVPSIFKDKHLIFEK